MKVTNFKGDDRWVETPYGKMRTEDWLRQKLPQSAPPTTEDPRTTLYRQAVEDLIADRKKPTDALVAEKLEMSPRTVGRWRRQGLIP